MAGELLSRDANARIHRFNAGREPERLALKYREMCKSQFSFFRGTAHLFWEDLAKRKASLTPSPLVWACGDLHLENFGSFQGNNGLSYFDLNDFDEAALAPACWEVSRFIASIYVAAPSLDFKRADANALATSFLGAYRDALADGKPSGIERATATGMVRTLLHRLKRRKRAMLIDSRTEMRKGKRSLVIDDKHTLPATDAQRREVSLWLGRFAKSQPDPKFFEIIDVARRVAGVGSLGLARYVVLARGDGKSDGQVILDAKQAPSSSLARFEKTRQPRWKSEADRVVAIQHRMQAIAPAMLDVVKIARDGFVLRELQPTKDRLTLKDARGDVGRLHSVVQTMGRLTAWAQLRSSGRQGSATIDDLISFAGGREWRSTERSLIAYGQSYQAQVKRDYARFMGS
ncbi:MAG: DUF2252 family protein [Gemmatimonadaceae bacterium]